MPSSGPPWTAHALRALLLASALGAALALYLRGTGGTPLLAAALGLLAWLLVGAFAMRPSARSRRSAVTVLAVDVLAVGALGAVLTPHSPALQSPFLAAYVVAVLVAAMGRRGLAALLGALAGAMILALGLSFFPASGEPDLLVALLRTAMLVTAAPATAFTMGAFEAEARRRALSEQLEREIRSRDAEAAELVTFTQALARSEGLAELGEAVLRHLRCHVDLTAHAVVLEAEGEHVAVWEEKGRLEPDHVENRRQRLQTALAAYGSPYVLARLHARSLDGQPASPRPVETTIVEVPIQAGSRTAGMLLVCDPRRAALAPQRIGVLADVARRTGEALLRFERSRSEETRRTALLLRQMREGVLLLGPDGRALLANPALREALELVSEDQALPEAIGEVRLDELARTPPGVSRRFRATLPRLDGRRTTELSGTAVGIVDGRKRLGTLVTLRDITDEELSRRRLMQAEKMTLVGQTLAGVAHELNNPLAALIGYADLLRCASVPEALERPLKQMREQAMRATRIVRNLLNFARKRNPQRVAVQVADLAQATVELFAYEARMNDVTVHLDIAADLPTVLADPHAVQQVLVNLVQNAIHALAGSERRPRQVTVAAHATPDGLMVQVRDNGTGVPAALRTRIFEPFFTTKGASQGTGLGLALARAAAREHGGELLLEPDTGEGACFTLRLPRRQPSAPYPAAEGPADAGRVPASVLVVDDEASVRESLVAQLGHLGSRVESACDMAEAQRMLLHGAYDAVLLDVRMPGGSGIELHRALAARNPELARRVVFMTGDFVNDDVLSRVRETGNQLLEKPFTIDELAGALVTAGHPAGDAPAAPGRPTRFTTSTS